jgi:MFS family permease
MPAKPVKVPNQFLLSFYWFAWELHWSALLGAAMQAQVARFIPTDMTGRATAILSASGALFSIASQYAAGRASDRAGKRIPFIIIGTLLDIVALFGFALSPSFLTAVLAFVAVQISLNIAGGPYQALIPDKVPREQQGGASGVMGFLRLAGIAGGLLLAKLFVVQPGPLVPQSAITHSLVMLAAALSAVLLGALAFTVFTVPDVLVDRETSKIGPWPEQSSFVWLIVSRSLVSMGLYLILPFFARFLQYALHVDTWLQTSLTLLLLINGFSLAGTLPAGYLADRLPKKAIMFVALAFLAIGAFTLSRMTSMSGMTLLAAALGVGWGAYYAVDWALACNLLPEGRAGALMALWNIGASGPQVISPAIGGILIDKIGAAAHDSGAGYRVVFELMAAYVVLGMAALAFVREKRGGKPSERP